MSDELCAWVANLRFDDLQSSAMFAAKRVLLDATGVMLGASGVSTEAAPFIDLASGTGPCAILGTGQTASAPMAALANGALAHALDYEDAFDRAPGHPNASLVPALIALAQEVGPLEGPQVLTALVAGCEVSCRLGLALQRPMEAGGWYPPPILAGIGAAVGAAKLCGASALQMRDAISLALCQVTMPGEIKYSAGTVIRAVREAFPAQAAVLSARLAMAGVSGFEQPLEGPAGFFALYAGGAYEPDVLRAGLGEKLCIEELTFKPWPSCRGTHPFIEMALGLRRQHQIDPGSIAQITVGLDGVQRMLAEPPERKAAPVTAIDAKFSIPFTTALALQRGRVTLDDFSAGSLADETILVLAGKVEASVQTANRGALPGSGGMLLIESTDGRCWRAECATALGSPEKPLSESDIVKKFVDCAGRAAVALSPEVAGALAERILSLERCPDVGALFA